MKISQEKNMAHRHLAMLAVVPLLFVSWVAQGKTATLAPATSPIHVQAGEVTPANTQALQEAAEDYQAVVAGKRPVHAVFDKHAPLPADGGTTYYIGKGYRLTILCRLVSFDGSHGVIYFYGPIITFGKTNDAEKDYVMSNIQAYSPDALRKLKGM